MRFIMFLEEKISFILFQISFLFLITLFLIIFDISYVLIIVFDLVLVIYTFIYLYIEYYNKKKNVDKIINLTDGLDEKYLISELIPVPKELENKGYYYALKKACKSMNDKIGILEENYLEYQEYIESFAHEIKNPISALSLTFDNDNNYDLKEELAKIDNLVEQMLYYARSDNTEKDYFIKEIKLNDLLHPVILNYKSYLLKYHITLNVYNLEHIVYTDEKWLCFILSQLIQNSIKYLDKEEKQIEIYSIDDNNNIILFIKDNGCGINNADLSRIFYKGFTGNNRKKEHSTGIGLYLSKKLCDRLGLKITVKSLEGKYTEFSIIFPKNNIYKID